MEKFKAIYRKFTEKESLAATIYMKGSGKNLRIIIRYIERILDKVARKGQLSQ